MFDGSTEVFYLSMRNEKMKIGNKKDEEKMV